ACDDLRCQYGEVTDLSRGGVRVVYGRRCPPIRVGEKIDVKLVGVGSPTVLPAEAVWIVRRKFRVASVGFRFLDIDPSSRQALAELAHAALDRRDVARA